DGVERLLIIPHDILHTVPFHALARADGRYLLEDFIIAYAPSAAVADRAAHNPGRKLPAGTASVGFGVASAAYLGGYLTAVPSEMQALGTHISGITTFEGDASVRRRLLNLSGPIDVLHFACHAEFDATDPLLSRLYLADGPVYAYELLAL